MASRSSTAATFLVLAALGALLAGHASASTTGIPQDPAGLFMDAPGQRLLSGPRHPSVVRSRPVTINPALLPDLQRADSRAAPPALLHNLFDDVSYMAVLDQVEPSSNGFTWVGGV